MLGAASQAGPDEIRIIDVDDSNDPSITLTVVLPAELANTSLFYENFSVTENGVPLEFEIDTVRNDSLEVVLLIDTSGSMSGEPLLLAQQAATDFILDFPVESSLAVVGFGGTPAVVAPMGSNADLATAAVSALVPDGNTPLYDAVATGLAQFTDAERQTLIILSDGEDTSSLATLEEIQDLLLDKNLGLVGIALGSDEAESSLSSLAEYGVIVRVDDPAALADIYEEISATLVSQYLITFEAAESGALDVEVTVTSNGVTYLGSTLVSVSGPEIVITRLPAVEAEVIVRTITPPTVFAQPDATGLGTASWVLLVGAIAIGGALMILALVIVIPAKRESAIAGRSMSDQISQASTSVDSAKSAVALAAERFLERRGKRSALDSTLERADIQLRAGEFIVMVISAALIGTIFGFLLGGIFLAAAVGVIVVIGSRAFITRKARVRGDLFSEQLPTTLQLLAGNLRTGHGISQALSSVASESESPTSDELKRVVAENRLGRDLGVALTNMSERLQDEDFEWVVQAISINREVGGDLAEILDNVQSTIADRNRIRRQIVALSADGRLSMFVLISLPFVVALGFMLTNPGYLDELVNRSAGRAMLFTGLALIGLGWIWLKRVTEVKF